MINLMLDLTCPDGVSLLTLDVVDRHLPEPAGDHAPVSDGRTGQAVLTNHGWILSAQQ